MNLFEIKHILIEIEQNIPSSNFNEFERNFLASINKNYDFGKDLSIKQEDCLLRIHRKYCSHINKEIKKNGKYDPYEILGVSRNDNKETIRKAYKSLILKYHPDRLSINEKKIGHIIAAELNVAYESIR